MQSAVCRHPWLESRIRQTETLEMNLPLNDRIILAKAKNEQVPPNIRETDAKEENCIYCLNCSDEIITICHKYSFITEWEYVCDSFEGFIR
jgi:hypothetical protein